MTVIDQKEDTLAAAAAADVAQVLVLVAVSWKSGEIGFRQKSDERVTKIRAINLFFRFSELVTGSLTRNFSALLAKRKFTKV